MLTLRFKGPIELSLRYSLILKVKLFCRVISTSKVCVGEARVRLLPGVTPGLYSSPGSIGTDCYEP